MNGSDDLLEVIGGVALFAILIAIQFPVLFKAYGRVLSFLYHGFRSFIEMVKEARKK